MGKSRSLETNRAAALAFAQIITQSTGATDDQIARRGNCSIFSVLLAVCPSLVRGGQSLNSNGLSEIEFIKMLQVSAELPYLFAGCDLSRILNFFKTNFKL